MVQLVDLDPATDTSLLLHTLAQACGVRDFSGGPPWHALIDCLADRRHLLVLDNAERVIEPLGTLVSDLLATAPTVRILVTSRQPLGCHGEHQLTVPSLSAEEGLALLIDRAAALGVSLPSSEHATGQRLCQRLDGLPLSIELAARRLRTMPVREFYANVDDRLRLLTGGPRHGGHPAHDSLRAMLDWSWELCTPAERTLWARHSVFPASAGCDFPAATHICADLSDGHPHPDTERLLNRPVHQDAIPGATVDGEDMLTVLDGLIDKQIVVTDTTRGHIRYRMLDTLRLYAAEALADRDETTVLRARHSAYYSGRTHHAARSWFSPYEVEWLEWAEINLPNLHQTYTTTLADRAADAVQFAADLTRLRTWFFTGSPRQGLDWLHQALAATPTTLTPQQTEQVITGHAMAGWIALWQGQPADTDLTACQILAGDGPVPPSVAFVHGAHLFHAHADPHALDLLAAARTAFTAAGPEFHGDAHRTELTEAMAAAFTGTREQALEVTQRCLEHARTAKASRACAWAGLIRAMALMWHGDPTEATALARQTLAWGRDGDDRWGTVWAIHIIAWALAEQADHSDNPTEIAATIAYLLGGAERARHRTGLNLPGLAPFATATTKADTTARTILGTDAYTTSYRHGRTADPGAVIARALGEPSHLDRRSLQPRRPQLWDALSAALQDVAQLAAEGLSNADIAAVRGRSARTVETQMTSILRVLGITTRHQIADKIPARDTVNAGHATRRP